MRGIHRWISSQRAIRNVGLRCYQSEQPFEQTVELRVIWDAITLMWLPFCESLLHHATACICNCVLFGIVVRTDIVWDTVYPNKYAHGFCFAVLCCGYTLTDFPISIRLTSLALWQSDDCPSASKATLMNMDKYLIWIHYERLHNHNKAKRNKTVCIFIGIYCTWEVMWGMSPNVTRGISRVGHNEPTGQL